MLQQPHRLPRIPQGSARRISRRLWGRRVLETRLSIGCSRSGGASLVGGSGARLPALEMCAVRRRALARGRKFSWPHTTENTQNRKRIARSRSCGRGSSPWRSEGPHPTLRATFSRESGRWCCRLRACRPSAGDSRAGPCSRTSRNAAAAFSGRRRSPMSHR
jgi:hypothetical protein